jgi:hypothetical protein
MGYVSDAQRKAVHASKADGGKGNPNKSAVKKLLNGSPMKKYTQPSLVLDKSLGQYTDAAQDVAGAVGDKVKAKKKLDDELYAGFDNPIAMKSKSPAVKKLSASCKAAARAKFDVYPSAYANMWAAKRQRQGKC